MTQATAPNNERVWMKNAKSRRETATDPGRSGARGVDIVPVDHRSPMASGLRSRYHTEVWSGLGPERIATVGASIGTGFTVFVLACNPGDRTVYGCGGLRYLDKGIAEIRNMYVLPEHRGQRTANTVLTWLESYARSRNWSALRLEVRSNWPAAIRFYERNGYTPIPRYGPYTGSSQSLCYEKTLRP
jgi:putative acetyltransferase